VVDAVAGHPRLVLLVNRATRDQVGEPAVQLATRLSEVPFLTVVRVDLRGVPRLFRGLAWGRLRQAHANYVSRTREVWRSVGAAESPELGRRLVMVGDAEGGSHAAFGLEPGFGEAIAVVEDASGREVARGAFPRDAARLESALRALGPTACVPAAPPRPGG